MNKIPSAEMRRNYALTKNTEVGAEMCCPGCGAMIVKKTYQHTFCGNKCKDRYWNTIDPRKKNRRHPPSHYRKYNVGPKSYAVRLGQDLAIKKGYPTYADMIEADAMDDPSWDMGGGVEIDPCERCGMVYQHCQCPDIPD